MAEENGTESITAEDGSTEGAESTDQAAELGENGQKALAAERSRAKEAERKLRAAEKALEAERAKGLSEAERAIADAKAEGRSEAIIEAGKRLARAEIRAAGSEKGLDVAALLEDLDLSRFVDENGEPDDKAIAKAVSRWAAIAPASTRPRGDVGQGNRGQAVAQSPRDAFAAALQGITHQ